MSHPEKMTPRELGVDTAPYRGHAAVATTVGDLGRVLQLNRPVVQRGSFPDEVYERIDRAVADRLAAWDEPFVARMLADRWRIVAAVYGPRNPVIWPVAGKSPASVLDDCLERIRNLHWSATRARRDELRQAAAALVRIIGEEEGQ